MGTGAKGGAYAALAIGTLVLGVFFWAPQEAQAIRGPGFGVSCLRHTTAAIDPALDPEPGHAHDHLFYGGEPAGGLAAETTADDLRAAGWGATSCLGRPGDTNLYWHPAAYEGNDPTPLRTARITAYWDDLSRRHGVVRVPHGLELIGGYPRGTKVQWKCGDLGEKVQSTIPWGCAEKHYRAVVHLPNCWNGWGLEETAVVYREGERPCPGAYPRRLPDLRIAVVFNNVDRDLEGPLTVSVGHGELAPAREYMHADAIIAAQQPNFNGLIQNCIREIEPGQPSPERCLSTFSPLGR